jgi:hypothetical protein
MSPTTVADCGPFLQAAYLIVAIGFWEHVDEPDLSH